MLVAAVTTTALLTLCFSVYVGRTLGPVEFADFAAAISFLLLGTTATGPINGTVAKFAARYASRDEPGRIRALNRAVAARAGGWGLVGLAIGLVALSPLTRILDLRSTAPLLIVYAVVLLTLVVNVDRGVLRGVQHFGKYSVNIVCESGTRLLAGVALLAVSRQAAFGIGANLVAMAFIFVLTRVQLRDVWRGHAPARFEGAEVALFAVPMFALSAGIAGLDNIDMLFVKSCFSATDAGVYGAAWTLARGVGVFAAPFNLLLLPLISGMHEQGRGSARTFLRVCAYFLLLVTGPMLILWLWSEPIVVALYGTEFAAAASILPLLAMGRLIGHLGVMIGHFFLSTNRYGFLAFYLPALGVEVLVLAVWHPSLTAVVTVIIVVQSVTFVVLAALLVRGTRVHRGT